MAIRLRLGGGHLGWVGLATIAGYLLAALLGLGLREPGGHVPWWPPAGVALAAAVLVGPRIGPALAVASALAALLFGASPVMAFLFAVATTVENLLWAWVLARGLGFDPSLSRLRDVLLWIMIAVGLAPWLSSLAAATFLPLREPTWVRQVLASWASGALGNLLVGSMILVLSRMRPMPLRIGGAADLAGIGLAAATLTAVLAHASSTQDAVAAFASELHLPLLLWAALRFGPLGAGVGLAAAGLSNSLVSLYLYPTWIWFERSHLAILGFWSLLLGAAVYEGGQAIAATSRQQAYLRSVLDSLPFEAWTTDASGRYQYQNPPSRRHWGDMVGRLPTEVAATEEVRHLFDGNTRRALLGETVNAECTYPVGGPSRTVLKIISPVVRDDDIIGTVGVNIDVTDIKAMETTISTLLRQEQELRCQAETALAARTDFMRVASHELRTPLTIMAMALHALRGRVGTLDGAARTALDGLLKRCEVQAGRLTWLIQAMFYAAESAVILPRPDVAIDLSQTVAGICDDLTATAAGRGAPLRRHLDADCHLTTDPVLLKDVVFAVIDNAIKFGEGKPIDVHVSDIGGGLVRLQVEDQGIGMTEAQREQVFERHFRGVPSEHYGGVGLGLWFSKQVVDRLGGEIRMQATPGSGCCVTIVLPKEPPQAVALAG